MTLPEPTAGQIRDYIARLMDDEIAFVCECLARDSSLSIGSNVATAEQISLAVIRGLRLHERPRLLSACVDVLRRKQARAEGGLDIIRGTDHHRTGEPPCYVRVQQGTAVHRYTRTEAAQLVAELGTMLETDRQ